MTLVEHAESELRLAGLFDEDSDYDGALGPAILEVVKTFSSYGHSGFSAMMSVAILEKLLRFEPLTPLTNNPQEWYLVAEEVGGKDLWQSRRNSEAFSNDGGKTYKLNSEYVWTGPDEDRQRQEAPLHTSEQYE